MIRRNERIVWFFKGFFLTPPVNFRAMKASPERWEERDLASGKKKKKETNNADVAAYNANTFAASSVLVCL